MGHSNLLAASYAGNPIELLSGDSMNQRVAERLENAENLLKQMNQKVDILRKEKKTDRKEMKKLAKRINSVSMSRDSLPLTARNFNQPTNRKIMRNNPITTDSQVNLGLSDEQSNTSFDHSKVTKNSRYENDYKKYEYDQDLANEVFEQNYNFKNYTVSPTIATHIKHAVANLADPSNDYSEDMDESVAFSKGFSDKENFARQKSTSGISGTKKGNKKTMKTNRAEVTNKLVSNTYNTRLRDVKNYEGYQTANNKPSQSNASFNLVLS